MNESKPTAADEEFAELPEVERGARRAAGAHGRGASGAEGPAAADAGRDGEPAHPHAARGRGGAQVRGDRLRARPARGRRQSRPRARLGACRGAPAERVHEEPRAGRGDHRALAPDSAREAPGPPGLAAEGREVRPQAAPGHVRAAERRSAGGIGCRGDPGRLRHRRPPAAAGPGRGGQGRGSGRAWRPAGSTPEPDGPGRRAGTTCDQRQQRWSSDAERREQGRAGLLRRPRHLGHPRAGCRTTTAAR